MKKRYLHRFIIVLLIMTLGFPTMTSKATSLEDMDFGYYEFALKLQKLGVFLGDGEGFRLADTSNRLEALIILIRLLGKEEEAKSKEYEESVFSDVPDWGVSYVNYAVSEGLTNGVGQGLFGSEQELSPEAFVTFLLRALGYRDAQGDFFWEDSLYFANGLGLIDEELLTEIQSGPLIRNIMAKLSYDTLAFGMKNSEDILVNHLIEEGSILKTHAIDSGLLKEESVEQGTDIMEEDTAPSKIDNVNNEELEEKVPVYLVGPPSATKEQLKKWARSKGMSEEGISLIDIYFDLSLQKGLDPILQYVQMCIETGYLYKNRSETTVLDASYYNPCGLKTPAGGGDYDPDAHTRFASWYEGIDAHTDHSALYAGVEGYPKADTKDPRHFTYLFASGPTVELMAKKWVGDDSEEGLKGKTYENLILKLYNEVLATQ